MGVCVYSVCTKAKHCTIIAYRVNCPNDSNTLRYCICSCSCSCLTKWAKQAEGGKRNGSMHVKTNVSLATIVSFFSFFFSVERGEMLHFSVSQKIALTAHQHYYWFSLGYLFIIVFDLSKKKLVWLKYSWCPNKILDCFAVEVTRDLR